MNQSIREFAEQAKEYAINRLDETGELHKYYDVYFEKFAQLIVLECGNIAFEHWALTHSTSPQETILKHFGVEE